MLELGSGSTDGVRLTQPSGNNHVEIIHLLHSSNRAKEVATREGKGNRYKLVRTK